MRAKRPAGISCDQLLAPPGMVGEVLARELGVHVAGRDRVDGHAVGGVLVRHHAHELVDRALGRRVRAVVLVPAAAGHRGEEHDPAVALLAHAGQRGLGGVERAREVDRDDVVPVGVGVLLDRLAAVDADAVDEHVDAPPSRSAASAHRGAGRRRVAQVGLDVLAAAGRRSPRPARALRRGSAATSAEPKPPAPPATTTRWPCEPEPVAHANLVVIEPMPSIVLTSSSPGCR